VLRKLAAKPELMEPALSPGPKTIIDFVALYSHPLWLVERWALNYGLEAAEKVCAYDQEAPPTAVHLREDTVAEELRKEGVEFAPGALLKRVRRVVNGDITHTRTFKEGRVAIQDEASQLVALLVGTGERLLDCCAAPGGKTAILAKQNPASQVLAAELHPQRAELMKRRLDPWKNVTVVTADVADVAERDFDGVLADVPCSGTGTLARNPEIKWRLTIDDLGDLHGRQVRILNAALDRLRAGGRGVYSSCSLEPEENEAVIEEVLRGRTDITIVEAKDALAHVADLVVPPDELIRGQYLRTLPGQHPCDGFFAAVLEKAGR
jgi:16S rRNA (cytosine967-C5)-methyltransferase